MEEVIAHTSDIEGINQTLEEHLMSVADKSKVMSKFPNTSYLIGILHDLGKADPKWQRYIRDGKGKVNHTSAGAKWVNDNIKGNKHYLGVLKYVITSHHGYYDSVTLDRDTGNRIDVLEDRRMKYEEEDTTYSYKEVDRYFKWLMGKSNVEIQAVVDKSKEEFMGWVKEQSKNMKDVNIFMYRMGILIRYLLSVLKDADIEDTVTWNIEGYTKTFYNTEKIWEDVDGRIDLIYEGFTEDSPINKERGRMSRDVLENGKDIERGIVKIDMATGTGKTLTSLRYAVKQSKKYNKKRIFYITPYLSVLEQNADVIRDAVGDDDIILEHHSNLVEDEEDRNNIHKEMLKENWESPIVITTMVQFFNTIFKDKSSNIRRFKGLENSVIIIDEIQSLPPEYISLVNGALNELSLTYNSLIITCTATQPELDSKGIYEPLNYNKQLVKGNLVEDTKESKDIFTRTVDESLLGKQISTQEVVDLVEQGIEDKKSVLVVVDLKKAVNELYKECLSRNIEVIYLTTNLCAEHRISKIELIRDKLDNGDAFVVISTQLIEAGVDVDFNVVYRNVIGMDRVIQARGRCNREGKKGYGEMYVIDYEEVDLNFGAMRELKVGQDVTKTLLQGNISNNWDELIPKYYNNLYKSKLGENGTKGKVRGETNTTIYDLLSTNGYMVNGMSVAIPQYFKTAYQNANLIGDGGHTVVVPYKESIRLIEELNISNNNGNIGYIKHLMRKLQRYTVNHYNLSDLEGKTEYLEDIGVFVLFEEYYSEDVGLALDK